MIPRSIITVALLRLIILLITLVSLAKFNFTKILATDEKTNSRDVRGYVTQLPVTSVYKGQEEYICSNEKRSRQRPICCLLISNLKYSTVLL